jgi:hypothetical protein
MGRVAGVTTLPPPVLPSSRLPADIPLMAHSWGSLTFALIGRSLINPRLAIDLLRTAWAFRRRGWWTRAPFLPVPDRDYLRWRMYTAYGEEGAVPPAEDVIAFARWRRETMHL